MQFLPEKFFLCHELKTGGIAIGWGGVFLSVPSWWAIANILTHASTLTGAAQDIAIGGSIGGLINIIANILLVYGTKKENWKFLVPWLGYSIIEMITILVCYAKIANVMKYIPDMRSRFPFIMMLVLLTFFIVIYTYCWICVLSLLKKLKEFTIPGSSRLRSHGEPNVSVPIYANVA